MDSELDQQALILDDDERLRRLMTLLIQDLGVPVRAVSDFAGFKSNLNPATSLVLLDLSMPDVDGVEVIRHLSLIGFRGRLTIVSGMEQRVLDAAELLARRSGLSVTGTLRKPITPLRLQRHLQPFVKPGNQPTTRPRSLPIKELNYLLDADRLAAHYQPKLDLKTGRIGGAEALARCVHPTLGVIGPGQFLKWANDELIDRINLTLFDRVLRDMAHWQRSGLKLPIAINLTARSLADLSIPDRIIDTADRYKVGLDQISFEITETTFSEEMVHALDVLTRLRIKGIKLSIDDFGTGYSTEERLRELPFTELKIDRSLISALDTEVGALEKVQRCVALARRLKLDVVAEGVETPSQMESVRKLGVDQVQGFMVARPMAARHVPAWVGAFENCRSEGAA